MKRLGLAIAVSSLSLALLALAAIALLSTSPRHPSDPNGRLTLAAETLASVTAFNNAAARIEPPLPEATVIIATTPAPTPQPTPVPTVEPPLITAPPAAPVVTSPPARAPAAIPVPPAPVTSYRPDIAQALFGLLNNARSQNGVAPVAANSTLTASADYYTQLHFTTHNPYQLSHNLDGGPGDRAWSRGYCCAVGEILVTAESGPESMVNLWMNSPPHHDIIVDPQYHEMGVSCYGGEYTDANGSVSHPVLCAAEFGAGG